MARLSRAWWIGHTRQIVDEVNKFIDTLDDTGKDILKREFGGVFDDPTLVTQKGYLRSNYSKMNISKLQTMAGIGESILDKSKDIQDSAKSTNKIFNERLGVANDFERRAVLNIMDYIKNKVGEKVLDSHQIRDIALQRIRHGQSIKDIRHAVDKAIRNANFDPDNFIADFSNNGVFI